MAQLIPTPVTLEDLLTAGSDINSFNDGVKTQLVSPRTKTVEPISVAVTDDPFAANGIWTQRDAGGEWVRGDYKSGNNELATYTFAVAGTVPSVLVNYVVYPVTDPKDGNYPPTS